MPKINPMLQDDCGCRLDRETYLYVGKAVKIRNRLMGYAGGRRIFGPPTWIHKFISSPHEHSLCAAVWYVDRPMISAAECALIDRLKPRMNQKDRLGFAGPWTFRGPDQIASMEDLEPHLDRTKADVWVEDRPGVYAWFFDAGDSRLFFADLVLGFNNTCDVKADPVKTENLRRQCAEIIKKKELLKARRGFDLCSLKVARDLPFG